MRKERKFLFVFLSSLLALAIFVGFTSGYLKGVKPFLEKISLPIQSFAFSFFQKLPFISEDQRIKKLEEENLQLVASLAKMQRLRKENAALLDQFKISNPQSYNLIPARIVGRPGFIPGITVPTSLILDKGETDNIKVGHAVVLENNLVGEIVEVSQRLSKVALIRNPSFSFTAKTQNGAIGVVRAEGSREITLDNVLLSENIKINEFVLTNGDIDLEGVGIPADLVVGKITSIDKTPSSLFQRAKVESLINFNKLSIVFIILLNK